MSLNKRYYWLKLKEDFFDDDTIQYIEDLPNGKEYCLFYLKLCLKSLKKDGILVRRVGDMLIPFDAKKLSEITRTGIDTVNNAMKIFKEIGLIQILDNGELFMAQLNNMIGSETKDAVRKRIVRGVDIVHQLSGNCPPEKEIDKDKDKDKDSIKLAHSKNFKPPTVEEVEKYCKDKKFNIDPNNFVDFYSMKGWMIGKNKMKDWKAAVRTWERRDKEYGSGKHEQKYSGLSEKIARETRANCSKSKQTGDEPF